MNNEDKMIMDMVQKLSEKPVEQIQEFRKRCLNALKGMDESTVEFTNALCDVAIKRRMNMEAARYV